MTSSLRHHRLSPDDIARYRAHLQIAPDREVTATEARAILGITWHILRKLLSEERRDQSPLRWRPHPTDDRTKLVRLADVLALYDQRQRLNEPLAPPLMPGVAEEPRDEGASTPGPHGR